MGRSNRFGPPWRAWYPPRRILGAPRPRHIAGGPGTRRGNGSATADAVQACWQGRQDAVYGALLRVEKAKLVGVALTSQTGWALCLRPPKFRLLPEVSLDGVRFPDTPEAFQEELLRQAHALQCGHAGPPLDLSRLQTPVCLGDPIEDRDFISRMRAALSRPPEPPVAGAPPTYHGMEQAVKKGSPATSLDELPRPLVSALPGFGLRVLAGVLEALASGTPSRLLLAVLHLCLAKKLPAWLVCNSQPVMLEPYLRWLETGVVQDRRVTRRELRRAVPPEHFAYQRQLSDQSLALACRWLLAGWAIQHGEVWSNGWDEANAFCNPDREAAGAWDHEAPQESLSPWFQCFYDGLDGWVASPYSLVGPYKLRHGGAQGDSKGLGYFSKISEKRTEYPRHAVREGLYPEDRRLGAPDQASYVPRQPAAPHGSPPAVAFSDDRRHFALTGWGLA